MPEENATEAKADLTTSEEDVLSSAVEFSRRPYVHEYARKH
jgi:hypothetical protein